MQNQQDMFTPEQIEEKKAELMAFYKEQIEVLQLQKDYGKYLFGDFRKLNEPDTEKEKTNHTI